MQMQLQHHCLTNIDPAANTGTDFNPGKHIGNAEHIDMDMLSFV